MGTIRDYEQRGETLNEEERDRLRALVRAVGEAAAYDAMGLSRTSVMRALAGLPVRKATAFCIRDALRSWKGVEAA